MTRQVAEMLATHITEKTKLNTSVGGKFIVIIYAKPRDYICYTADECWAFIEGFVARQEWRKEVPHDD